MAPRSAPVPRGVVDLQTRGSRLQRPGRAHRRRPPEERRGTTTIDYEAVAASGALLVEDGYEEPESGMTPLAVPKLVPPDVPLTAGGPPETVLPPEPDEARAALTHADPAGALELLAPHVDDGWCRGGGNQYPYQ